MKLRKEQQLIKDFIFLKYNDFNLEALEKGIKIMYNMQKYNLISSYSMWKDLTEIYVLTKQELTKEFEKFIIDSFVAFFNKAGLDFLFNMIFSLELLSQDLVAYLFISPEFDLNFVAAIIYKLVMEKQFQYEIEVIMCVKKYSKKLTEELGKNYSVRLLYKMIKYYEYVLNEKVPTLSAKLSWSHFSKLLSIKNIDKINYYIKLVEEQIYQLES